jgi:hypothetical protein
MKPSRADALAHNVFVLLLLPMGWAVAVNTVPVPNVVRPDEDED